MKADANKKSISSLASLAVLALFAVVILSTLLSGADIYSRLNERDKISYSTRTVSQYVITKVRQIESPESIKVDAFGDSDALLLSQTIEDTSYLTRIYCYDGWLMELFTEENGEFEPQDGEKIIELDSIEFSFDGNILNTSALSEGGVNVSFSVMPRGRKAGSV